MVDWRRAMGPRPVSTAAAKSRSEIDLEGSEGSAETMHDMAPHNPGQPTSKAHGIVQKPTAACQLKAQPL